jgi:hypothetical protein
MFGLGMPELLAIGAIALLADVALLWVTTALLDTDPGWGKLAIAGVPGFALFAVMGYGVYMGIQAYSSQLGSNTFAAGVLAGLGGNVLTAIVSGVLFSILLSLKFGKGQWAGVVHSLLRLFLYSLIAGVIYVVLAVVQISRAPSRSAEAPPPMARNA